MSGKDGGRGVTSEADELNQWAAPAGPDALLVSSGRNGAWTHGARTVLAAVLVAVLAAGPERVLMP